MNTVQNIEVTNLSDSSKGNYGTNSSCPSASLHEALTEVKRYVLYRFLLFTDGINVSRNLVHPRSCGGIYAIPISFPPSVRRTTQRIRTITLTNTDLGANSVLDHVVNNIATGTMHGIDAQTPTKKDLNTFSYCVDFLTDFHESADDVDVLHHS